MRAGAVDLAVTYGAMFVYVITLIGDDGQPALGAYAVVFALGFVGMIVTYMRTRTIRWRDPRPMPSVVRASFLLFAAMLIAGGRRARLRRGHLPLGARRRDPGDVRLHLPRRRRLLPLRRVRCPLAQRPGPARRLPRLRPRPHRPVRRPLRRGLRRRAHEPDRLHGVRRSTAACSPPTTCSSRRRRGSSSRPSGARPAARLRAARSPGAGGRRGSPARSRRRPRAAPPGVAASSTDSAIVCLSRPRAMWTIDSITSSSVRLRGDADELAVDLQVLGRQVLEVVEGAEAGAEVVESEAAAELVERRRRSGARPRCCRSPRSR